jgi:ferredoxin
MIKNVESAKELVKKYRSITLEDLRNHYNVDNVELLGNITGFGNLYTCSLCKACNLSCPSCIWTLTTEHDDGYPCVTDTYRNIRSARTLEDLLDAIDERADELEDLIRTVK